MKSKFVFFLAAAFLASCGGNSNTSHPTGLSTPDASSSSSATYLDWVADNKIVIDLFATGNAQFSYGNAALDKASNTLDLSDSASISCSTRLAEEQTCNFVYVTETATELGFNAGVLLYAGIEGDKISEFLSGNSELKGKTRAYIAISFGSDVQWTKNKNAAMDAKIQQLLNASK